MKRNRKSRLWLTQLACMLVFLCATTLRLTHAQTDQQTEGSIPGVPAGYTIIDGDIQMPISVVNAMRRQAQMAPNAPQAAFNTKLWPNGIIPFQFEATCAATSTCSGAPLSGCVSDANQTAMLNAMAVLEAVANVDFRQCANNRCSGNFVLIRDSTNDTKAGINNTCVNVPANNSAVGMQGGLLGSRQVINIVNWGTQFIIVHELLHCLGFFHEQSRPDRDNFVRPNCNNVQGGCNGSIFNNNFVIADAATGYGYYDFDSVMHYGQCSFSVNNNCPAVSAAFPDGGTTITVLPPNNTQWQNAIGQRNRLSKLDRLSVAFLYPFADWRFLDCNYDGRNGPSNGTFRRPYTTFATAIANTPAGGTLWIQPGSYAAAGAHSKQITLQAPLGGVRLRSRWSDEPEGSFQTSHGDRIEFRIERNAVSQDRVEFVLTLGPDVTWKKVLVMPDGLGSSWDIIAEGAGGSNSNALWADQVHNGQSLIFKKAGFLGRLTEVYTLGDLGGLTPGSRVTFIWVKD